jgi:hypothetical protein
VVVVWALQVQAVRSIEPYLGLEKLYVMGTNCTDNGPRDGLEKFLESASTSPDTVIGYEFMQDYRVHLKHQVCAHHGTRPRLSPHPSAPHAGTRTPLGCRRMLPLGCQLGHLLC